MDNGLLYVYLGMTVFVSLVGVIVFWLDKRGKKKTS